jgi:hypothetical protein
VSWRPRRPYRIALWLVPLLVWLGAGAAIYGGIRTFRSQPQGLDTLLAGEARITDRTVREERRWVSDAIPERYLASPPGPPPCAWALETVPPYVAVPVVQAIENKDVPTLTRLHADQVSEWLPGLALSQLLVSEGKLRDAETVIREVARRKVLPVYPDDSTPDEVVLARIHQMQILGYLWIEKNYTGDEIWVTLKNPIGFSKIIARRRNYYPAEVPTWVELKLPPPGCTTPNDFLTTYDLYNNLIVGYLRNRSFHEEKSEKLESEFKREYRDPPDENPLLAVLQVARKDLKSNGESWVWALSNAERLLRERLVEGEGYPEDNRLALNLAQLMESAWEMAPDEARRTLGEQIGELTEIAGKNRVDLPAKQIDDFDRGLTRLILFGASRSASLPQIPDVVREHLAPEQQEVIDRLTAALRYREKPAAWAAVAAGETADSELTTALGPQVGAWRSVSRQDLADSLARLGLATDSQEARRDHARQAEALLDLKDARPEKLNELEKDFGWWWRFEPRQLLDSARGAALIGGIVGAFLAVLAYWFCLQLRLRKELFTSFYRAEVEQRLQS